MAKNLSTPQFEALRKAHTAPEWQHLPETHAMFCLRDRYLVHAQASTIKVLVKLGLVEKVDADIHEETGEPWTSVYALTEAGELVAVNLEYGGKLSLDYIEFVVGHLKAEAEEKAQQTVKEEPVKKIEKFWPTPTPGGITVTPEGWVEDYYAEKGVDIIEAAKGYVQAWADKVPSGTETIIAKMKCVLADGPCGCTDETPVYTCTGPYLPCPLEVLMEVLAPKDGGPCLVEGVEVVWHAAPEAIVIEKEVDDKFGKVYVVEKVGPVKTQPGDDFKLKTFSGKAMYVKKL